MTAGPVTSDEATPTVPEPTPDATATTAGAAAKVTVSPRRRMIGRIAIAVWLTLMLYSFLTRGLPFDRLTQTLWIISGFLVIAIGRPWKRMKWVIVDWGIFVGVFYLYDLSRAGARNFNFPVQVEFGINADKLMFNGVVPTVWLQRHFYDPYAVHWWDQVGALIYISHFMAAWIIAAYLYLRSRREWWNWALVVTLTSVIALIFFALIPTAPPWYANSVEHLLPPINRIAIRGLDSIGLHPAGELVSTGRAFANPVAAIPSLHTGFAVLVSLFLYSRTPKKWRWWAVPLLVLYPVAMLAMLVYSGEHYVIDGLLGAALAAAVWFGLQWFERWRKARKAEAPTTAGDEPVAVTGQGPQPGS